ncbi:hypothetical protein F4803DRAFT_546953 [Xylaria telfairii]|nr:hypothetical protein F4803DRAFT_546953 [Xylaria telfairii]
MSSIGQPMDPSTPTRFSKDRLRDALDGIIARRFFAGWNSIEQSRRLRDPEIVIDGIGKISLPLSNEQAQQIISKAHRTPSSNVSSEEIVDTVVQQNAWELGPQSFTITAQPEWDGLLKEFLAVISRTLGVSNRILRADLHKLSIWEKGDVFKAYADTETILHLFGTLMISLPSYHQGGDVIVRYLDEEATFSTYEHDMAGVFWCSDASHEVLPIEFGYRWVLTYNLVTTVSLERPLESPELGNELLRDVIESWARVNNSGDPKPLYYTLDHKYTEASLSPANLKPRDQACLEQLQLQLLHTCHDLDFHIFLATLELEEIREIDDEPSNQYPSLYDIEDDPETIGFCINSTLRVKCLYDLNGDQVLSSIEIDKDGIVHGDPFGEYPDPDDNMDDEEVTYYYYRSSALVIVPPKALVPLLASCGSDRFNYFNYSSDPKPIMVLNYCIDRYQSSNSESARDLLLQVLEKTGKRSHLDWSKYTVLAEKLYKLATTCDRSELMEWIIRCRIPLPLTILGWSRRQFEIFAISFERLNRGFSSVIKTRESLNDQYQVFLAFQADTDPKDELLGLIEDTPTKAVRDGNWGSSRSYEDGLALYNLALCTHDGLEAIKSSIIPKLVETCSQNTEFMLGFVHGWREGMQREEMILADSQLIYENLVRATVQNISIPSSAVKAEETPEKRARISWNPCTPTRPLVSYDTLYRFVTSLFQPRLEEQRDIFIKKIASEATLVNATNFDYLWIPLLRDLLFNSEELNISLFNSSWQYFYQTVLESFLWNCVGKAIPKSSLVRTPVSCECNQCRELNQFLLDPTQSVRSFNRSSVSKMTHFRRVFPDNRIDCTYVCRPIIVIITKVEDPKTERERNARARRRLEAADLLRDFDPNKLRTVLTEKHEAITKMSILEHSDNAATSTGSLVASSTQRREHLAPVSTNSTAAIPPLGGEKIFPVGNTLSSGLINSPYGSSIAYMTPNQPINSSAATMRTQTFASPQATMLGIGRDGLSTTPSIHPQAGVMGNVISSAPYDSTWQEPGNHFIPPPSTASIGPVSKPPRPLPSTMIRHPVAGAKRKMVELIDLTAEDD